MIKRRGLVSSACLTVALAAPASAQPPTLAVVLARAGAYVSDFERQLSSIVAEEHYVQEARDRGLVEPIRRKLRSDLLLVKPPGARDWLQFRDVYEVDGQSVRDREERLTKLFLDPAASRDGRIAGVLSESSRYNIGAIKRTMNTPVLALRLLEPEYQRRMKFKRSDQRRPATMKDDRTVAPHFRVTTGVWAVQFDEKERGTLIRTTRGKDIPARGTFWIEPATGRVLMSELVVSDSSVRATVDVSYQSDALLGILVPIEMRERYEGRNQYRIDSAATYGRFRQFQVTVDERLGPIKK